jgi:hypothetical protein
MIQGLVLIGGEKQNTWAVENFLITRLSIVNYATVDLMFYRKISNLSIEFSIKHRQLTIDNRVISSLFTCHRPGHAPPTEAKFFLSFRSNTFGHEADISVNRPPWVHLI